MSTINKFIETFSSNAGGVLGTITNENIEFSDMGSGDFDYNQIKSDLDLPLVLLAVNFSGDQNFQVMIALSKTATAMLADLMMLGDGSVEYNAEEHNDAAQEMFNQIFGSINAELSGEGISITGTVSSVELTDLDIQKDFMDDNQVVRLKMSLLGKDFIVPLFFDQISQNSIDNLFDSASTPPADTEAAADMAALMSELGAEEEDNSEPVSISKASFSNIKEKRVENQYSNINMDLLMDLELPITVELGRKKMKIKEILELGQGSVVELDKIAGDFVDILVNGRKFAVGEIMVVDENFAIRIVNLISREDRIKSLGQ